ncbi:MAG: hypothetical protein WCZ23_06110 [Rhodospirillaceae bacterium]
MRRITSAFQSGPLLPGISMLVVGVMTAALTGWAVLTADGRVPEPAQPGAITAPPSVAAHVLAPQGVQEALVNTLERQQILLESLTARLETRSRELELVRAELQAVTTRLAMPAHAPTPKPDPADPISDTGRLAALESEQARLEASRGEINRRIASSQSFIAEAHTLMSFTQAKAPAGS